MKIRWQDKVANINVIERAGQPSIKDLFIRKNLRWTGQHRRPPAEAGSLFAATRRTMTTWPSTSPLQRHNQEKSKENGYWYQLVEISGTTARCMERHSKVVLEIKAVVVVVVCPLQPSSSSNPGCPGLESSVIVSSRLACPTSSQMTYHWGEPCNRTGEVHPVD